MDVYEMACDMKHYTGFVLTCEDSVSLDELGQRFEGRISCDPWTPFEIEKDPRGYCEEKDNPRPIGDFTRVANLADAYVFSERAVQELGEVLTKNGEVLPLIHDGIGMFTFIVTNIVDAIDRDRTELFRMDDGREICASGYHFRPDSVKDLVIFGVAEVPGDPFVTDTFIEHVTKANLKHLKGSISERSTDSQPRSPRRD